MFGSNTPSKSEKIAITKQKLELKARELFSDIEFKQEIKIYHGKIVSINFHRRSEEFPSL